MTCEPTTTCRVTHQTKLNPRDEGLRLIEEARITLIKMTNTIEQAIPLIVGRDDFMSVDDESRLEEAQRLVVIAENIIERYLINLNQND